MFHPRPVGGTNLTTGGRDRTIKTRQQRSAICKQEDIQRLKVDHLFTACKSGNVNNARRLLTALTEINLNTVKFSEEQDVGELTLLTVAASEGQAEMCQLLLDKGANVNQRSEGTVLDSGMNTEGITPLISACKKGHLNAVNVLLAVDNIDVNYGKGNGQTSLFGACWKGHSRVVKMLLAVDGIQLNKALNTGQTPFYSACREGYSKVVEMLLAVDGIQVNQASDTGRTPLYIACHEGHSKIVELLLTVDGIKVNEAGDEGFTPLNIACHIGHSKIVELLLAVDDIQVNQANNEQVTPLLVGCDKGHSKVVEMLLAVDGIEVNEVDDEGFTPLNIACYGGHSEVVQMLLAVNGIEVNKADGDGFTPLMTALNHNHIAIIVQFLQHGIGHNNINEWFSINMFKPSSRIALYKYALLLPHQHQPLLDFHSCVVSAKNALVPTSALKVFKTIWPPLIGFMIESFLLPTKQTRQTMQQVIMRFDATLNDHGEKPQTQLYRAVLSADVESVRFLLLQEGILVNKCSQSVTRMQGTADIIHWRTPLYRAEKRAASAATNGSLSNDGVSRRNEIAALLRDAGGHV